MFKQFTLTLGLAAIGAKAHKYQTFEGRRHLSSVEESATMPENNAWDTYWAEK